MGKISKTSAMVLTAIIAMSCLTQLVAKPANAQTIPKPSVPEFSLRYLDHSYDVPPTMTSTTPDPYTGKTTTQTIPGYHVENKTIQVIITNPPFKSYKDENGSEIELYYDALFKGHYAETWNGISQSPYKDYFLYDKNAPITVISAQIYNISDGGQVDVEVRTLIGKYVEVYAPPIPPLMDVTGISYKFIGQASDWSNTQTIRAPDGAISISAPTLPNSTPSPTPTIPELSWLVTVPLLLSVFTLAAILRYRNDPK